MKDIWEEIRSDYQNAKDALWCPKKCASWRREEQRGYYYMWKAYHQACEAEPKDELLYARILRMMADECRSENQFALYRKYIKPSVEAYERAVNNGQHPSEKELDWIRYKAESIAYTIQQYEAPYDEQIKNIKDYELLNGFCFHDSEPIEFWYSGEQARLKLRHGDTVATFCFGGVENLEVFGTDSMTDYIMDFYCYPCFHNQSLVAFDIGYYKIVCSSVCVQSVERAQ